MQQFVFMPRNVRLQDLEDCIINNNVANWSGTSTTIFNPYALVKPENGAKEQRNRLLGKVQAVAKITDYLRLTGRVGLDWYNDESTSQTSYNYTITETGYHKGMINYEEFNADLILNFDKHFIMSFTSECLSTRAPRRMLHRLFFHSFCRKALRVLTFCMSGASR